MKGLSKDNYIFGVRAVDDFTFEVELERPAPLFLKLTGSMALAAVPRQAIDAAADRQVVFTFKNGATRAFTGKALVLTFSVPQFFFHITTAYDILRHACVDLAKKDFLGPPRPPQL